MGKMLSITLIVLLLSGMGSLFQVYAEQNNQEILSISAQTDRGYYAPGDIIRIRGTVTTDGKYPVNASLVFTFQEMKKTVSSGPEGSFLVTIPISLVEPENLYKLEIVAHKTGYQEKMLTIPIIIMSEPSSFAPVQEIPDEFKTN